MPASLAHALEMMSHHTLMQFAEGMETLLIYIENLIKHPDDPKYRKITISNIHFEERLGHMEGSQEALESLGFSAEGDFYVFDRQSDQHSSMTSEEIDLFLKDAYKMIQQRLEEVRQAIVLLPPRLPRDHLFSSVQGAATHFEKGRRPTMEDEEILVDAFCGDPKQGYFGLYDGHGGRGVVDFVVKALHQNIEFYLTRNPKAKIPEALKQAYLTTDGQVRRANILHSGTTSVSCIIREEPDEKNPAVKRRWLYCANVGDSRAVLSRKGRAIRMTIDHKPNLPEEAKRIEDAGGFIGRCNRVNGLLAISRALGDHMLKPNEVVSASPYTRDTEILPGDDYLLLACDGVWDVMEDQEAIDFIRARMADWERDPHAAREKLNFALEEVCRALVQEALDKKSQDNVTVMLIKL